MFYIVFETKENLWVDRLYAYAVRYFLYLLAFAMLLDHVFRGNFNINFNRLLKILLLDCVSLISTIINQQNSLVQRFNLLQSKI